MGKKIGLECKAYYASAVLSDDVTPATASWNEIDEARDITLTLERGEADVSSRASTWAAFKATLKNGRVDMELSYDATDTAYEALRDAWDSGDEIGIAIMDGDIETGGSEGFCANMSVLNMTRNEPLEDGVTVSVSLRPSSFADLYEVAGS